MTPLLPRLFVATLLAFSGLAASQGAEVQLEQEVFDIARLLRCPTCISETVADSDAGISVEMREIIRDQLREGRSRAEILAFFQERYGDWILLEPPRRGVHLVVWVLPVVVALGALALLAVLLRNWLRASQVPVSVSDEELMRVRQALKERS
jgi:cytochrome c-type biogenesis protein CcmH